MIDTPYQLLQKSDNVTNLTPLPQQGGVGGGSCGGGSCGSSPFCVILADGEQPEHEVPLRLLQEAPYIVCCDGAIQRCDFADAVVGDGDSIPSWAREEYDFMFHQENEQDDNDLTKATRFCIKKGFRRIVYLAATGRREDHTLGNISLLMRYAREFGIESLMATNYGWFVSVMAAPPTNGLPSVPCSRSFSSFPGQQVSIFNFGCTVLRTEGLRYDGYPFTSWWQGTLNEATADHFSIVADGDYLVYRTYESK